MLRRRQEFLLNFRDACKYKNVFRQIIDVAHHKLRINTSFEDYYLYDFYKSGKSWEEKSLYIGASGSRYWPCESNSLKFDRRSRAQAMSQQTSLFMVSKRMAFGVW